MVTEVVLVLERLTVLLELEPLSLIVTLVSPDGQQPALTLDWLISLLIVVCELASPVFTVVLPPVLPEAELSPVEAEESTVVLLPASLFWVTVVSEVLLVVTVLSEPE